MKDTITPLPDQENWKRHSHILQHLFTWLTGYEIIFEGSRKDLVPEVSKK